jgi:hypothetical protein
MQQLVEGKGYTLAERTATRFTTTSKYVQAEPGEVVVVRKWFFFHQRQPASNPPVSFRLRVRAFPLPTGTQLQLLGVYIHEGCAECAGAEECVGSGMQRNFDPHAHPYVAPGHRAAGALWDDVGRELL